MKSKKSAERILVALTLSLIVSLCGCNAYKQRHQVSLGEIYNDIAQLPDSERNPVVVIPGILGSRLVDSQTGDVVWGEMGPGGVNPLKTQSLTALALPMRQGVPLDGLHDQVQHAGPLDQLTFKFLGIPIHVNAYAQILAALGVGGYRDQNFHGSSRLNEVTYSNDHFTCFQFAYDWRRDISESAALLHQYIEEADAYTRQQFREQYQIENPNVKFDIVAHSMGGLVARYYLRYGNQPLPDDGSMPVLTWEGARRVGRVFLVGTPNLGSTLAITEMKEGLQLAPPLPKFPPAVIGTMPSVYQLFPRNQDDAVVFSGDNRRPDMFSGQTWRELRWGITAPSQDRVLANLLPGCTPRERRNIAIEHQAKCLARAEQFHRSLDLPAELPAGLEMHLFAGDAKPTLQQILVEPTTGRIVEEIKMAGDGTVTRTSAVAQRKLPTGEKWVPLIPWTDETFLTTDHLGLTRDRSFVNNVLYQLLNEPQHGN